MEAEQVLRNNKHITLIDLPEFKTEEWYSLRENTIGGSDIGSLFNENKYKHKLQLFNEKTGLVKNDRFSNQFTYLGIAMEKPIIELWEHYNPETKSIEEMHKNLIENNPVRKAYTYNGYIKNDQYPKMQGEVDGMFFDKDGNLGILEIKTQSGFAFKNNDCKPPMKYLLQVQAYMALTGATFAELVMLVDGVDFQVFQIDRNDEVIEMIKKESNDFWYSVHNYLEARKDGGDYNSFVPEVDELESCEDALNVVYKTSNGNKRNATNEEKVIMESYIELNAKYKEMEKDLRLLRNKLKEGVKEDQSITHEKLKCSWSNTKTGRRFTVAKLK